MHSARNAVLALSLALVGCAVCSGCSGAGRRAETLDPSAASPCPAELHLVLGACVSRKVAAAYCGATAVPSSDGRTCAARPPCDPGRPRDLGTAGGECLPLGEARALAAESGVASAPGDILVCAGDGVLVASASARRIGCFEADRIRAGRDRQVPPLTAMTATGATGRGVDAARWLRAAVGADGGSGAPPLCDALARAPGALASPQADARVSVSLVFPDNDVSSVIADVRYLEVPPALSALSGSSAADANAELENVVGPMVEALRSLGGTSIQASVSARVRCPRARPAERPRAVPPAEPEK